MPEPINASLGTTETQPKIPNTETLLTVSSDDSETALTFPTLLNMLLQPGKPMVPEGEFLTNA